MAINWIWKSIISKKDSYFFLFSTHDWKNLHFSLTPITRVVMWPLTCHLIKAPGPSLCTAMHSVMTPESLGNITPTFFWGEGPLSKTKLLGTLKKLKKRCNIWEISGSNCLWKCFKHHYQMWRVFWWVSYLALMFSILINNVNPMIVSYSW